MLLLAHEVAEDTLADAQRLAAGVLAEAGRQAEAIVGDATDGAVRSAAQQAASMLAEAIGVRHEDIVAMFTQVRDELRGVCDALAPAPVSDPQVAAPSIRPPAPADTSGRPRRVVVADQYASLRCSDEHFIDELYHRIAGAPPAGADRPMPSLPGDRATARRAAERAAAERAAIQAEALERQAAYRRSGLRPPEPDPSPRADVVISMTGRRNAGAGSGRP